MATAMAMAMATAAATARPYSCKPVGGLIQDRFPVYSNVFIRFPAYSGCHWAADQVCHTSAWTCPPLPQPPQATLNGILLRAAPIEPIYGDGDDVDAPPELHASLRRWEPNRLTKPTIPTKTAKDDTTLTQPVACFYPVGFVFEAGVRLLFL